MGAHLSNPCCKTDDLSPADLEEVIPIAADEFSPFLKGIEHPTDAEMDLASMDTVSATTTAGTEAGKPSEVDPVPRRTLRKPWWPAGIPREGVELLQEAEDCREQKELDQALGCYTRALDLLTPHLGADHSAVGMVYCQLGFLYSQVEPAQVARALEAFEQAITVLGPQLTEAEKGKIHSQMGNLYSRSGEPAKAAEWYTRALAEMEPSLGRQNYDVSKVYLALGEALSAGDLIEVERVLECYEKALEGLVPALGATHPDVGRFYAGMAHAYMQCQEYEKCIQSYEAALRIFLPTLGHGSDEVNRIFAGISAAHVRQSATLATVERG